MFQMDFCMHRILYYIYSQLEEELYHSPRRKSWLTVYAGAVMNEWEELHLIARGARTLITHYYYPLPHWRQNLSISIPSRGRGRYF